MRGSSVLALFCALLLFPACVQGDEPQSLSATVNGTSFSGDDDTILFVPLDSGEFTLGAATAGAASYPPPKTPIDRLSIVCAGYVPGKPLKLGKNEFSPSGCYATFTVGTSNESFSLDKNHAANRFEITASRGKVIEGNFELHFANEESKTITVSDGRFVVEDRQY